MNSLSAAVLLCVIYASTPALSIKCYACSGPGCQDPFTPVGTASVELECTPELAKKGLSELKNTIDSIATSFGFNAKVDTGNARMVCAKVKTDTKEGESSPKVTRTCALHSDKADFCELTKKGIEDSHVDCSICEEDLCNGGSTTHIRIGLITAVAVILMSIQR